MTAPISTPTSYEIPVYNGATDPGAENQKIANPGGGVALPGYDGDMPDSGDGYGLAGPDAAKAGRASAYRLSGLASGAPSIEQVIAELRRFSAISRETAYKDRFEAARKVQQLQEQAAQETRDASSAKLMGARINLGIQAMDAGSQLVIGGKQVRGAQTAARNSRWADDARAIGQSGGFFDANARQAQSSIDTMNTFSRGLNSVGSMASSATTSTYDNQSELDHAEGQQRQAESGAMQAIEQGIQQNQDTADATMKATNASLDEIAKNNASANARIIDK